MKIYLATGNLNKKREMAELFPHHQIVIPSEEGIVFEPDETGETFYENSLIKARTLYEIVKAPVIADDSGICVDALGGRPGIYSARYAGPLFPKGNPDGKKISQEEQNIFLIEELNNALKNAKEISKSIQELNPACEFLHGERSCHYTCAFVYYFGNDRFSVASETFEGSLIENISESRGNGGFGYDPIVFLSEYNKTVAELSSDEKNEISHRGKAVKVLKSLIG